MSAAPTVGRCAVYALVDLVSMCVTTFYYESCTLVEFIERYDLRCSKLSTEQFERHELLFINSVHGHKLLKASRKYDRSWAA